MVSATEICLLTFQRPEVQDQGIRREKKKKKKGIRRVGFFSGLSPKLLDGFLLTVSTYGLPSVPLSVQTSSPKDTNHIDLGLTLMIMF